MIGSFDKRRTVHVVGVVLLVGLVAPFVVFAAPQLVGAEHSYVVLSASMSPAIEAGDVVIVNGVSPDEISQGDVITFQASPGHQSTTPDVNRVTHRVVEVVEKDGQVQFRTKGDANEEADAQLVPGSAVVGTVLFSIPFIGYFVTYAGTKLGIIAFVVVPSVLLIVGELWDLLKAARAS